MTKNIVVQQNFPDDWNKFSAGYFKDSQPQ